MKNQAKKSFFGKLFSKKPRKIDYDDNTIITPTQAVLTNFKENRLAMTGLFAFAFVLLLVFVGSLFMKFDENYTQPMLRNLQPGMNYLNVPKELNGNVEKIVSGASFSFAIDKQGNLHHWGKDTSKVFDIPKSVKGKKVADIAAGDRHVVALLQSGEVVAWGNNEGGQIDTSSVDAKLESAQISKIFTGSLYSGVVLQNKKIITWGSNSVQQLTVKPEWNGHIVDVAPSSENLVLLMDDGTVRITGATALSQKLPKELTDGSVKVKKIVTAYLNAMALTEDGKVITWGAGGADLDTPKTFDKKVIDITAGQVNFTVLLEDGTVHSWGDSAVLGEKDVPNAKAKAIFGSAFQNYMVQEDGKVQGWGLKGFFLGSDELGRAVFTRLIFGGRTSLLVGILAAVISTLLGLMIGLISGFVGGRLDNFLMRFGEIVVSIPFLPLVITLYVIVADTLNVTQRMYFIMGVLGFLSWVGLARLVRGQILIEREKDFVLASRALGIKESSIIFRHILPSVLSIAVVSLTLSYAGLMLTESGLSFLGFGVVPPTPTWGNMLTGAQKVEVIQIYWWRWVFPALAVFITVLAVNLVGDGLNSALDPKANEK